MRLFYPAVFRTGFSLQRVLRAVLTLVATSLLLSRGPGAHALSKEVQDRPGEYEVKAALLFHFLRLVDWPKEALPGDSQTITIGVFGHSHCCDPIAMALNGKKVKEREIRVLPLTDLRHLEECQLVFLTTDENDRARKVLETLKGHPVLTVGETRGFAKAGGMLNFQMQEHKVRFEVNPGAAERVGLTLAPELLKLGTLVRN